MEKNSKEKRTCFSLQERIKLQTLLMEGKEISQISFILKRSYTGLYKEIKKNGGRLKYDATKAHKQAIISKSETNTKNNSIRNFVQKFYDIRQELDYLKMNINVLQDQINNMKTQLRQTNVIY